MRACTCAHGRSRHSSGRSCAPRRSSLRTTASSRGTKGTRGSTQSPLHEHPCGSTPSTPRAHDHRVITASQRVAPIAAACNGNRCEGRRALQREQQPAMRCYLLTRPAPSREHARAHGLMSRAFTANGLPLGRGPSQRCIFIEPIYRAYIIWSLSMGPVYGACLWGPRS